MKSREQHLKPITKSEFKHNFNRNNLYLVAGGISWGLGIGKVVYSNNLLLSIIPAGAGFCLIGYSMKCAEEISNVVGRYEAESHI